jgi:cytochrome c553
MRKIVIALALASAAACDRDNTAQPPAAAMVKAELTFEGAKAPGKAAMLAHGERLSHVLGCRGCHGKELVGKDFYGVPSANLTRDIHKLNDAQFVRALREGQRTDKRDMWAMPSEIFQHLGDADMSALIAYLRTLKPAGEATPPLPPFDAKTREEIASGKLKPASQWVRETKTKTPVDLGEGHALGRYITMVTCAECHGSRLEGVDKFTPDLIVAGAYTREEFEALMTKGVPNGPRKLELMASVGKNRFSRMTRQERDAVYAYLKARAEQPQ